MLLTCVLLAAPIETRFPSAGLDPSWMTTLNVARQRQVGFGSQIIFTYGPWGFLDYPLGVSRFNLIAAAVFGALVITATWSVFNRVLRRVLPELGAAVVTTLLVTLASQVVTISSVLLVAAALAAMDFIGAGLASTRWWTPAAVAGCAALLTQIKFSEGLVLVAIALTCAVFAPAARLRRSVEAVASLLLGTAAAWLLAGQSLGDVPAWLRGSGEVARGYTEAMSLEGKPNILGYLLIGATICVSVTYLVRMAAARHGLRAVVGVALSTSLMLYLGFREGTGRHGPGHQHYFFLFALPALTWFVPSARSVASRWAVLAGTVLLTTAHWLPADPHIVLAKWSTTLQTVLDDRFRTEGLSRARVTAERAYGLSPAMTSAASKLPITVDPAETTLPWAYDLEWRPTPAFQSYFAYTARLDRANAQAIMDAPSEQAILRSSGPEIDGRNVLWDPPRYLLAELCHYRVAANDNRWMLLRKSTDRCSAAVPVSTQQVAAGQPLTVPSTSPDQILVVSFTERTASTAVRLGRSLNKSFHPLTVKAGPATFRLPTALADGPLLVSLPASAGWPAPFGGSTTYRSLAFSEAGVARFSVISLAS